MKKLFVPAEEYSFMTPKPKSIGVPFLKKYKSCLFNMKKSFPFSPLIIAVLFCGVLIWWLISVKPVSTEDRLKTFIIAKGSTASIIGKKLKDQGFTNSATAFKLYVQATGKQRKIQAGEYKLSSSWSLFRIVDQFIKGPTEIWVTIPEGLRKEEIAERVIDSLGNTDNGDVFRTDFLKLTENKEGYLFPDTYLFPQDASASAVVKKLTDTFNKKIDSKLLEEIEKSSYSLDEVITIASLLERETRHDSERSVVAGIIYKRLESGWPLQIDATVQYALAALNCRGNISKCDWWPNLSKENMQINSSYNSYKFKGLSPTPICNPGFSSIRAAVYPETSPYWFYLHDMKGEIHFARTIEEHNSNISIYLK